MPCPALRETAGGGPAGPPPSISMPPRIVVIMLRKVAITASGAGGQVTILTSPRKVPMNPPTSARAFTDVGCTELSRISDMKSKRSIGNLTVLPLKRRRVREFFLSAGVDTDIDIEHSPYLKGLLLFVHRLCILGMKRDYEINKNN